MMTTRFLPLAMAAALLASCGGNNDGVKLGEFPAITMIEGEEQDLTAPSSKSPAPFTFSSDNPAVAAVSGKVLIAGKPGTATITAQQGQMGSYNPTSTSTTVTVAGYVSQGGFLWSPVKVTASHTAAEAKTLCEDMDLKGSTEWRLPTQAELTALQASVSLTAQGWQLAETWTSTPANVAKTHIAINLSTKATTSLADDKKAAVTCVKAAG